MVAGSCIATVMVNKNFNELPQNGYNEDHDDFDFDVKVLNYHHRLSDTHEMPDWVSTIFLQWLPWLLRYFAGYSRVAKCQGYWGYIRVKMFAGWGKKFGRTCNFAKSLLFGKIYASFSSFPCTN